MKLSNFPYLVQQEILHNIGYADLFMLSFVSKNLKKLIKSSQIPRFKSINSIVYEDNGGNPPQVFIHGRNIRDMILQFADHFTRYLTKYFRLNVNGTMIGFGHAGWPWAYGHPSEPVIESIHNYLPDLFGSSVQYRCRTSSKREWFFPRPIWFFPPLQNVSVLRISCDREKEDIKEVWNNFSLSPDLKHIDLSFMCQSVKHQDGLLIPLNEFTAQSEKLFPPECKLYQAESIETTQFYISTPAILSHFKGRQAILKCVILRSLCVIEFVNRWKSGEAFQKLEYLKVHKFNGGVTNVPQILDRIGAKYIDASKTPPRHNLPKVFIEYHDSKRNTLPITSHTYVVRESDNRVASVLIQGRWFKFGVWDKTEEEFLRMMK
ncbi:hypothetical protein B9Z55_000012 [Caenorhabditis nigoni]|uniref:F-box domain-containing protein n=1 Tax=Caenorhabditis nigoni TaxID=1611254 RepID=A0A2G5VET8_9PELO|nr:hypothetical protein B9Z55_000012 [Caenorhabditis nigoni]